MTTLFILQTTPTLNAINAQAGDAIILINDSVKLACGKNASVFKKKFADTTALFALQDDLSLRGLTVNSSASISTINYAQFVDLTIHHHQIQTC